MTSFIKVIDGVLPLELCSTIVDRFEATPSQQEPGRVGSGVDRDKKRSTDLMLDRHPSWASLRQDIADRIFAALCGYAMEYRFLVVGALSPVVRHPLTKEAVSLTADNFAELGPAFVPALLQRCYRVGSINVQKYEPRTGGYPHWHSENYPEKGGTAALHRVLFLICYLNDVESGGETEFAYQGMKVTPRAGRLLIAPAAFTHTHRGNAPQSSAKYILSSWLLFRPGEALFGG